MLHTTNLISSCVFLCFAASCHTEPPSVRTSIASGGNGQTGGLGASITPIADVSGDGVPDVACGAPSGVDPRVFILSGQDLTVLQTLACEERAVSFGRSIVAVSGGSLKGPTLIVGAPREDASGGFIEVVSCADWTTRRLDSPEAFGLFGYCVAPGPDLTGDGTPEVLVGTPIGSGDKSGQRGSVFLVDPARMRIVATWSPSGAGPSFGEHVTVGVGTGNSAEALVTQPGWCTPSATRSSRHGELWIIDCRSGEVVRRCAPRDAALLVSDAATFCADFDRDGRREAAAVCARLDASGETAVAQVVVFDGASGHELRLSPSERQPWSVKVSTVDPCHFSIAEVSDQDHDGFNDLVVGASTAHRGLLGYCGVAVVLSSASLTAIREIEPPSGYIEFGWCVSSVPTGGGEIDLLVGAPDFGLYAGALYAVNSRSGTFAAKLTAESLR